VAALAGYAAWCLLLFAMQDGMVFPRGYTHPRGDGTPPMGVERVEVVLGDGSRVEGWFAAGGEKAGPAVLYFHGNAELIDDRVGLLREYQRRGWGVLLAEYPGYGRSEGRPSERTLTESGVAFFDLLAAREDVDATRIVLHGTSLGGGVAAQVGARREAAGLILETTFTSVASFARGYAVPGFLVRHPFRTDEAIRGMRTPLLILHGDADEIVPVGHGRALARLRPDAAYVEMAGGHNDFPRDAEAYWRAVEGFLRRVGE
jgi:fermentation-respiration switch protein FrsA (DUF1100 family)